MVMDYSGISFESSKYFYSARPSSRVAGHSSHNNGACGNFSVDDFKSDEYFYSTHPSSRVAGHGLHSNVECGNFSVDDFKSNEYFHSAHPSSRSAGHGLHNNVECGNFSVDDFKSNEYFHSAHPSSRSAGHDLHGNGECGNISVDDFIPTIDKVGSLIKTNQETGKANTSTTCSPAALSRRRTQNRLSQRAFRKRKEQKFKDLEIELAEAKQQIELLSHRYGLLLAEYERLTSPQKQDEGSWKGSANLTVRDVREIRRTTLAEVDSQLSGRYHTNLELQNDFGVGVGKPPTFLGRFSQMNVTYK